MAEHGARGVRLFVARFDTSVLEAPIWPPPELRTLDTALLEDWRGWAHRAIATATPTSRPQPGAAPIASPLDCRVHHCTDPAAARRTADALGLELDGSAALQARRTRAARLLFRLRVKLADVAWWRVRQPDDPWDSGSLIDDPQTPSRLVGFRPRRPTWIVLDRLAPALRIDCLAALRAAAPHYAFPVRVLVIEPALNS